MDWITSAKKLTKLGKQYRYVLLVVFAGILLMLIPGKQDTPSASEPKEETNEMQMTTTQELSAILSRIEGVGKTQVMLTVAAGEETVYQNNSKGSMDQPDLTTVTVTDSQRSETGLVRQVNPPVYKGAIVVCEGADSPAVCLQIMEAVSHITGLGTDRISVLKMK